MSYLVLARKWRPQRFEDVVGQGAVVRTLRNALARGRVPHAMIFSGVRGVGKTTLARLMAKAICCPADDPPCNACESCQEITSGTAIDLHEIDGASNRGIQEIRDLKEHLKFLPAKLPYKIYIIDEVHMLTNEAFNALLKTLEEPPDHVYFMFATTEVHKVPVTILSRCQRFALQRIPFAELAGFFRQVAEAEGVALDERAVEMITREAGGSVRDGLSLLDQVISFGGDTVGEAEVADVLGLVDRRLFLELVAALLAGDLAAALVKLDRACRAGVGLKRIVADLLVVCRALVVIATCQRPEALLDCSDAELAELRRLAEGHPAERLQHFLQLVLRAADEVQRAADPRTALEMLFIRLCEARRITSVAELLQRVDKLLASGAPSSSSAPPPASAAAPAPSAPRSPAPSSSASGSSVPSAPPSSSAVAAEEEKAGPAREPAARNVKQHWQEFLAYVKERKAWMAQVLGLALRARQTDDGVMLTFDDPAEFKVLQERENLLLLTEYLQDFFQREMAVSFRLRGQKTVVTDDAAIAAAQEERRALARDPLVQAVVDVFGGEIAGIRTGPRFRQREGAAAREESAT